MTVSEARKEQTNTIHDPELQTLAKDILHRLQVSTEIAIAHEQKQKEFRLPEQEDAIENAIFEFFMNQSPTTRAHARDRVARSLGETSAKRRERFGKAALADPRAGKAVADQSTLLHIDVRRQLLRTTSEALSERSADVTRMTVSALDNADGAPFNLDNQTKQIVSPDGGPVHAKYQAFKNELGSKIGDEQIVKDVAGRNIRIQRAKNGVVVLGPKPEAFAIFGAVFEKFEKLGGVARFPGGPPISDTIKQRDGGFVSHFHDNYSVLKGPKTPACEVHGAIRILYATLGFNREGGYPTTDEVSANDLTGRISRFERGSIPWHPKLGAIWVPRPAAAVWEQHGGLDGFLGYPLEPAEGTYVPTRGAQPFFRLRFQGGSIRALERGAPLSLALPTTAMQLKLESVHVKSKTKGEIGKDEVNLHGVRIEPDGSAHSVPNKNLGKFDKGQKKNVAHEAASWNIHDGFVGWPVNVAFVAGFWEDDLGGGESDFAKKLLAETRKAIEKAVEEGLAKLGDAVTAATKSRLIGRIVGAILGAIAGWLLNQFFNWLKKLWNDDLLTPYVVSLELSHADESRDDKIGPMRAIGTTGRGAHYVAEWQGRGSGAIERVAGSL